MSKELQQKLTEYVEKAVELRFKAKNAEFATDPVDIHSHLVSVQEILSELEKNLSLAIRAKYRLEREVSAFKFQFQESWDKSIIKTLNRPTLNDYSTGKERSAEANLATLSDAIALRKVEETKSFADEAVEIIRLHYYGLDKLRQDLKKRLDLATSNY